jgi:hypothetical protein
MQLGANPIAKSRAGAKVSAVERLVATCQPADLTDLALTDAGNLLERKRMHALQGPSETALFPTI